MKFEDSYSTIFKKLKEKLDTSEPLSKEIKCLYLLQSKMHLLSKFKELNNDKDLKIFKTQKKIISKTLKNYKIDEPEDEPVQVPERDFPVIPPWKKVFLFLISYFPILTWIREYKWEYFKGDLIAGITTGTLLVPQVMSYAIIAGLNPIYGLYATLITIPVYFPLGTGREFHCGPAAVTTVLTGSLLASFGVPNYIGDQQNPVYLANNLMLALSYGIVFIILGFFKLGFLASLASQPVISGFTSASATIILFTQIKYLLGIEIHAEEVVINLAEEYIKNIPKTHGLTLLFSICFMGVLIVFPMNKYLKKIPVTLVLIIISIIIMFSLDKAGYMVTNTHINGIKVIGQLPAGFPKPDISFIRNFDYSQIPTMVLSVVTMTIISFIQVLASIKYFSIKNNYKFDTNQELIAVGLSNILASLFYGMPASGSLSRTSVNAANGAKSTFASLISWIFVCCTLLFLTPILYYLPFCFLASMICVSVLHVIDIPLVIYTWKFNKLDSIIMVVTYLFTAFFGIQQGVIFGISASLIIFVYRMLTPNVYIYERIPGTNEYVEQREWTIPQEEILVITQRVDLCYLNTDIFYDKVFHFIMKYKIRVLIIDCRSFHQTDSKVLKVFEKINQNCHLNQIYLFLACCSEKLKNELIHQKFDKEQFFDGIHDAVNYSKEKKEYTKEMEIID